MTNLFLILHEDRAVKYGYENCIGLPTLEENYTCKMDTDSIASSMIDDAHALIAEADQEASEKLKVEAKRLAEHFGQDTIEHLAGFIENFGDDPTFLEGPEYAKTIDGLLTIRKQLKQAFTSI